MKIRKKLCLFLSVLLTTGTAAVPAHTLEAGSPGSLTESFIDEATGREIAPAQVSKSPWVKEAPEIAGYEFTGFTQETRHIYSQEDLTYILGYPDKTVQGEGNLRRSEAVAIFYRLHAGAFPPLQRQMNRKTFLDVAGDAWFYKELEMCYNIGMVEGIGETQVQSKRTCYPRRVCSPCRPVCQPAPLRRGPFQRYFPGALGFSGHQRSSQGRMGKRIPGRFL